jgi:hypothetical protein
MGKIRNACNILVRKHEGMRSLGRLRQRCEGVDCISLAQDRGSLQALVSMVTNFRVS